MFNFLAGIGAIIVCVFTKEFLKKNFRENGPLFALIAAIVLPIIIACYFPAYFAIALFAALIQSELGRDPSKYEYELSPIQRNYGRIINLLCMFLYVLAAALAAYRILF